MLRVMLITKTEPGTLSRVQKKTLHHDLFNIVMLCRLLLQNTMVAMSPSGWACIVPVRTRVGDLVMILGGSHMPWVLRPVETQSRKAFCIIVPVYVYGAMDGEAVSPSTRWSEVALV
jgi:hypothetical protein